MCPDFRCQVSNTGLFLGEGKTSFAQPFFQGHDYLFSILFAFAKHHKVICVSYHRTGTTDYTSVVMFDTQGFLHTVQCDICQQGANHTTLRGSRFGVVKDAFVHIARFQPLFN